MVATEKAQVFISIGGRMFRFWLQAFLLNSVIITACGDEYGENSSSHSDLVSPPKMFFDYCIDENADIEIRKTVAALKLATNEADCGKVSYSVLSQKYIRLDLSGYGISDLTPLTAFERTLELNLSNNNISDLSPLLQMRNLSILKVSNNQLTDLSALNYFVYLNEVDFSGNQISDLSDFEGKTFLRNLDLADNDIEDLSPLSSLEFLDSLTLSKNSIKELSPLNGMTTLKHLWLDENLIEDVSPLVPLESLLTFSLSLNPLGNTVEKVDANCPKATNNSTLNTFCSQ